MSSAMARDAHESAAVSTAKAELQRISICDMVRFLGLISIGLQPTFDFQSICEADLRSTPNISALTDLFARSHWTVADGLLPLFATEGSHPLIGGTAHVRWGPNFPTTIDTPILAPLPKQAIAQIVASIPMGRMGSADEIAKVAVFLASDDSSFVTGIELFVDGGTAQV
jgi:hypothetical protein